MYMHYLYLVKAASLIKTGRALADLSKIMKHIEEYNRLAELIRKSPTVNKKLLQQFRIRSSFLRESLEPFKVTLPIREGSRLGRFLREGPRMYQPFPQELLHSITRSPFM